MRAYNFTFHPVAGISIFSNKTDVIRMNNKPTVPDLSFRKGDIIDILYHCFKVNGYEIKILYRVDKVGNIEGTFSLIIDDSDFIVQKINSLVINEETLIDLDNIYIASNKFQCREIDMIILFYFQSALTK